MAEIKTGRKLFEFSSKQDWINRAQRVWRSNLVRSEETICIDQLGRICRIGKDFMSAERDSAYPIEVFMVREDLNNLPDVRAGSARQAAKEEGT